MVRKTVSNPYTIDGCLVHSVSQICPYLDLEDVRCSGRLTMQSLSEAYRLCFGNPAACPIHHLLACDHAGHCDAELEEVSAA
jgi:hypothetical protein